MLPATRHRWTLPTLAPAMQAGTRFTYPGGRYRQIVASLPRGARGSPLFYQLHKTAPLLTITVSLWSQLTACHEHPTSSAGALSLLKFALWPEEEEEVPVWVQIYVKLQASTSRVWLLLVTGQCADKLTRGQTNSRTTNSPTSQFEDWSTRGLLVKSQIVLCSNIVDIIIMEVSIQGWPGPVYRRYVQTGLNRGGSRQKKVLGLCPSLWLA